MKDKQRPYAKEMDRYSNIGNEKTDVDVHIDFGQVESA